MKNALQIVNILSKEGNILQTDSDSDIYLSIIIVKQEARQTKVGHPCYLIQAPIGIPHN